MTVRSRRGLAFLLAAAIWSLTVTESRAEPAERPRSAAPIARVIQQAGKVEDFSIRTQTATASARATDWIVEARSSETSVFVLSGVVTVADAGPGASLRVSAGEGSSVALSAADGPAAPKDWGARRAADALSRTGIE